MITEEEREAFRKFWESPKYLGDSVYARYDGCSIILETRNGLPNDPSNTIILEPEIIDSLKIYDESLRTSIRKLMKVGEFEVKDENI